MVFDEKVLKFNLFDGISLYNLKLQMKSGILTKNYGRSVYFTL